MSKDTVTEFYEALKADRGLAEEFKKAAVSANLDSLEKATNFTMDFAAEKGFIFTADALKSFEKKTRELSSEELNNVNAAQGSGLGFCFIIGLGYGCSDEYNLKNSGWTLCITYGLGFGAWVSAKD